MCLTLTRMAPPAWLTRVAQRHKGVLAVSIDTMPRFEGGHAVPGDKLSNLYIMSSTRP